MSTCVLNGATNCVQQQYNPALENMKTCTRDGLFLMRCCPQGLEIKTIQYWKYTISFVKMMKLHNLSLVVFHNEEAFLHQCWQTHLYFTQLLPNVYSHSQLWRSLCSSFNSHFLQFDGVVEKCGEFFFFEETVWPNIKGFYKYLNYLEVLECYFKKWCDYENHSSTWLRINSEECKGLQTPEVG